ncbi:hypothetical protein ACFQ1E_13830 [Sphingomonas canadensis]|uniref:SnoaL-like domain-containing protein n=1 Tax=Sphingomonas canadensis TaxID=1219257 RepID=A0ABW3H9P3_9SPHN|nr:hypothetical protein [Sphingomonas canadensis]MCW3836920.1 hypothetical protein [Sphingomonas canadensis]
MTAISHVMDMPASDAMRASAERFFHLLYVAHDFRAAMEGHAGPGFVEHNPDLPNSPADQLRWFQERAEANQDTIAPESEWRTRFVHRFIVGDYLVVHYFMSIGPQDRGRMFADFWRFEGDRIVEHWDVVQPVPETTLSGNPMW